MKNKIYTTGYTGKDVADLPALVASLGAMLADIRFTPYSQLFEWRRDYLKLLLKEKYRHVSAFGNRSYRENKITIHNFSMGLKIIESWSAPVILMCACEKLSECHRFAIMNGLREKDYEVEEIENWKAIEFSRNE